MPPKSAYPNNFRPAFKPPRPVGATATAASKAATGKPSKPAAKSSHQPSTKTSAPITLSSDASSDEALQVGDQDSSDGDGLLNGQPVRTKTRLSSPIIDETIPLKLLARLLHEHFKHDDTRIAREAMGVLEKYLEIFAREAIARGISETRVAGGGGLDFLEVEDLEKLAPQLLMDF